MIRVYCQGGLGNQLFQYAAGRFASKHHGVPLVIDPYWFDHPLPGETPRRYELDRFNLPVRLATPVERQAWRWARGRSGRLLGPILPFRVVREPVGSARDSALKAFSDIYMIGYWQSENYFAGIRDVLRAELALPQPTDAAALRWADRIDSGQAVSMHVRRGDYVSLASAAAFHGTCSPEYYDAAARFIGDRVEGAELYVFSDDPDWCRTHLRAPLPMHHVSLDSEPDQYRDLWLMSRCRHHIIANSSFSWWGAWLGEPQHDRIVVGPKRWFAAGPPTPDLLPERWKQL